MIPRQWKPTWSKNTSMQCLYYIQIGHLMLSMKKFSKQHFEIFYFSQKTGFNISCKLNVSKADNLHEMSRTVLWENKILRIESNG